MKSQGKSGKSQGILLAVRENWPWLSMLRECCLVLL